jgi:hypothetical protein
MTEQFNFDEMLRQPALESICAFFHKVRCAKRNILKRQKLRPTRDPRHRAPSACDTRNYQHIDATRFANAPYVAATAPNSCNIHAYSVA